MKDCRLLVLIVGALAIVATIFVALRIAQYDNSIENRTTSTTSTTTLTTQTTTQKPAPKMAHFPLTDAERDLVERVVMAEAGGESFEGQKAVAQCILNASKMHGKRPTQVVVDLKYTKARPNPSESVKQAVAAVFDDGAKVFGDGVIYFYAPALVKSAWHESQVYVTTIGGHRFFKEASK